MSSVNSIRGRRWIFVVAALVNLGFHPVDLFMVQSAERLHPWLLWARVAFSALLLLGAFFQGRRGEATIRAVMPVAGAFMMVVYVALTGGGHSYLVGFAILLPPVLGLMAPERHRVHVAASAVLGGGLVVVLLLVPGPVGQAVMLIPLYAAVVVLMELARRQWVEVHHQALEAEQARRRAMEDLAESERRRGHSERLALIGQIAAGVTHEINNPLSYVRANVAYLAEEARRGRLVDPQGDVEEVLDDAAAGIERIAAIVSDLKCFARDESEEGSTTTVGSAVDEAVRLASVRLRDLAVVERALPETLPDARIPHGHLVQILLNLLVNAGDALGEARTASSRPGRITIRAEVDAHRVRLRVEDDGPGLPEGREQRLFDPFFTTKPPGKGTGLGLALSREFVSRVGGDLWAENRPEGGAAFTVALQRAETDGVRPASSVA